MCISRRTPFVETVSSQTSGAKIVETKFSSPLMLSARLSDFFIATRFGTSSPKTRVTYESRIVITMMQSDSGMFGISCLMY